MSDQASARRQCEYAYQYAISNTLYRNPALCLPRAVFDLSRRHGHAALHAANAAVPASRVPLLVTLFLVALFCIKRWHGPSRRVDSEEGGGVYPRGPPGLWSIRGAGLSGWAASASAAGEEWVGHVTGRGWVGGAKDQGDEQTASQERAMATCVGPSLGMPVVRPLIFSNSSKKTIVSRPCLARSHSINLPFDE